MTYFRVYSGSVKGDSHVWNQKKGQDERLSGLHLQRGKEQLPVGVVHAGDLGCVAKLSGDGDGRHPV